MIDSDKVVNELRDAVFDLDKVMDEGVDPAIVRHGVRIIRDLFFDLDRHIKMNGALPVQWSAPAVPSLPAREMESPASSALFEKGIGRSTPSRSRS